MYLCGVRDIRRKRTRYRGTRVGLIDQINEVMQEKHLNLVHRESTPKQ